MNQLSTLQEWVESSSRIVFFGGAGVSTESGIPDFRSVDGLYKQNYDYPPEEIISHSFFMNNPEEFYRFYKDRMIYQDAKPNVTHRVLAKWEQEGKLSGIVTQNIDGLHQLAGSKHVVELHGSILRNTCMKCKKKYTLEDILAQDGVPYCECGGIIKPDVVLYDEGLNPNDIDEAIRLISGADMLIIAGTSLVVQPAASLVRLFRGDRMVLINRDSTPYDQFADLVFHDSLGDIFKNFEK